MSSSAVSSATSVMGAPADRTVEPVDFTEGFGGFFRNKLINGSFDFWQRGDNFGDPTNGALTADRWLVFYDGTIGSFFIYKRNFLSQDMVTAKSLGFPIEVSNYLRWDHTDAGSGSTIREIRQRIEGVRTFADETIVVSFWAKADTNRNISIYAIQDFGIDGSPAVSTADSVLPLTTDWQFLTATIPVPAIDGMEIGAENNLTIVFSLPINVTMTIDIALVQAEIGNYTAFEHMPVGLEYELCRRYFRGYSNQQDTNDLGYQMYKNPTESGEGPYTYEAEILVGGL